MHLFFTPTVEAHHSQFILSEEESKHAIRVLRLTTGDTLCLVDGRGGWYTAEILDPHPKRTTLHISSVQQDYQKSPYFLHIAVAPTKSIDRLEWFIEKACEIGIQEITPIICEHSERKEVKVDRMIKVAVAAMKQSLKAYLPQINPPVSFSQFLKIERPLDITPYIAHCIEEEKFYLNDSAKPGGKYLIMIGPEGDFSKREIQQCVEAGYTPITLGNSRLRTETAAITSCLEISLINR
ncbi:MAG: 16S rRNA (uracil(1498)-N(3))-methyltransferase [Sphingobacterium sp.]